MRLWIALLAATAASLLLPSPASALFHLVKVREVYVGTTDPSSQYVQLQMYAPGQRFVGGHTLDLYDPGGAVTPFAIPGDVPSGDDQRTILLSTPAAEAEQGVQADFDTLPAGVLTAAGGAVCFETIDCVAWGSFGGAAAGPTGANAPAMSADRALHRTIAPSCPTLLEAVDDSDDSATDFSLRAPAPRSNATAPVEAECDTRVAGPEATAKRVQRQRGRRIVVKLLIGAAEEVTATAKGKLKVGRRSLPLDAQTKAVAADALKRFRLKPARRGDERKARRALSRGKRVRAKLKAELRDAEGNREVERLKVRLK